MARKPTSRKARQPSSTKQTRKLSRKQAGSRDAKPQPVDVEWAALSLAGITAASKHRIGGIEIGIDRHIAKNVGLTDRQRDALQTLYSLIDLVLGGSPSKQEEQRRGDDGLQWTKGGHGLLLARRFPLADVLPRIRTALIDFLKEAGAQPPDYRPPRPPSMIGHKKKDPLPDPLAWIVYDALDLLADYERTGDPADAFRAGAALPTILLKLHVLSESPQEKRIKGAKTTAEKKTKQAATDRETFIDMASDYLRQHPNECRKAVANGVCELLGKPQNKSGDCVGWRTVYNAIRDLFLPKTATS